MTGTLGTVDSTSGAKTRALDVSIRVGTPKLDNYHRVRGDRGQFTSGALVSYEDNVNSIKRRLWLETDRAYRTAAERLIRIKTNTQVKVAEADDSDDFSAESPSNFVQAPPKLKFTEAQWQEKIRKYSARFQNYQTVLTSHVSVMCQTDTRYLVNSEGSRVAHGRGFARVVINAGAKAADGTDVSSFETFEAVDETGLPDDKVVLAAIDRVANDVSKLLKAPEAQPFVGSGDSFRACRGRLLSRNFRPSRRRPPAEGRERRPDLHQERRHEGAAGFPARGLRSHAPQGRRRRPERLVRLRRRRRQGPAGHGSGQRRAEDLPDVALADQRLSAIERTRAAAAGTGSGLAAVEPAGGIHATRCPTRSCARC